MKNRLKKLYQTIRLDKLYLQNINKFYVAWSGFIISYIMVREIIGLHALFIYIFLLVLLICRFSFLKISLTFFIITLTTVLQNQLVEANNYMSYVFIFFVLFLVKEYYLLFIKRKT